MMADETHSSTSLPGEAAPWVWQLLGVGASPFRPPLGHEFVKHWVLDRVSCCNQAATFDEIRTWFHTETEQWVLRDEFRAPIAMLILHTIEREIAENHIRLDDDIAFWAIGSVHPDIAEGAIRSQWGDDEIQIVVNYLLETLNRLCKQNQVVNPDRIVRLGSASAKATVDIARQEDLLRTFNGLSECELLLYPGVLSVVALLIKLDPELFGTLVERVDHLVVQRWAAFCAAGHFVPIDLQRPLEWIKDGSPDAAIALGIVHTLENVNHLDANARSNPSVQFEHAELDNPGSDLLSGLLDRLASIETVASARWIIDLLGYSVTALHAYGSTGKPERVQELENLCIQQLEPVVSQHWSSELSRELCAGLRPDPLIPRNLPLAQVAWKIREACPARADEIAQMILDEHEQHIAEALDGVSRFSYLWDNWTDHDSILGLAIALIILGEDPDPLTWVLERCGSLPLGVWDAEDSADRFRKADEAARIYFVVAFYAVQLVSDPGDTNDPALVRALAERLWDHCNFVGHNTFRLPKDFVAAEFAARVVMAVGKPSESWIMEQVRKPAMSPRILWALVESARSKALQNIEVSALQDDTVRLKLLRGLSDRYGNSAGMDLDDLRYLGKLWLLLGGANEAKNTAVNILEFAPPQLQRSDQVTALELFAFAANRGKISSASKDQMDSLYKDLWSGGTPSDEIGKLKDVDDLLGR